jgi:hypothetical protein
MKNISSNVSVLSILVLILLGCGKSKAEKKDEIPAKPKFDYYCSGCKNGFYGSGFVNTPKGTFCSQNCYIMNY